MEFDDLYSSQYVEQFSIPYPSNLDSFNQWIGPIKKGMQVAIGGLNGSGKKSLLYNAYLFPVIEWYRREIKSNPKLHARVLYFSLNESESFKYQTWLLNRLFHCTNNEEIESESAILLDINCLEGNSAKFRDLTDDDNRAIEELRSYVEDMNAIIDFIPGRKTPSAIAEIVRKEVMSTGAMGQNGSFVPNIDYFYLVIIDDVNHLLTEPDGQVLMTSTQVRAKMKQYLHDFKEYDVTSVAIVPTKSKGSGRFAETEPSYRDLEQFEISDLGIVMYAPNNEKNRRYGGVPAEDLLVNNLDRLRIATVVRNVNNANNILFPLIFLGECKYLKRLAPHNEPEAWEAMKTGLRHLRPDLDPFLSRELTNEEN